jgi:hypothetical protein
MNGAILYDGGLDCYGGFDFRKVGTATWARSWYVFTNVWPFSTARPIHSWNDFVVTVSNLTIDTRYEYRAIAKNSLTEPGVVYGNITQFTTWHETPPATPPGGPVVPEFPWLKNLSSNIKLLIGLIVTIGGMIVLAFALAKSKAVVIVVLAWAGICVIGFTVIGWYPQWVIILLGAIVGLGLLFLLAGKK